MNYRRLIFSFLILTTGLFVYPNLVRASTIITENITENTTWTLENSPYIVENSIFISGFSKLTIEPGVVVKFADFSEIYSNEDGSSIIALGTSDKKIYFTSLADDDVGGDTENNGPVAMPEITENSNTWYGVSAGGQSAHISFDNVVLRYSIYGLSFANILDVNINNSIFEKNYVGIGDGGKSHVSILNTKIINNYKGISIKQTVQEINSTYTTSGLSIYGNFEYGVQNLTRLPPPLTRKDHNIFDWLVDLFTPNSVLAQEELVVIEEDPVPDEEYIEYDYTLDFKNTWWGDASGPRHPSLNPHGQGNAVSGDVLFTPFCKNSNCTTRNPVIIVPGLLGTEISKPTADGFEKLWLDLSHNFTDLNDNFMDALQLGKDLMPTDASLVLGDVIRKHTTAFDNLTVFNYSFGLIEEFHNQGYVEGIDLFLFPYDWRYGVSDGNVEKLKQKILDILEQTGAEKVDLVAHSTGGLLVKKYIKENSTHTRVDKVVFVGVPNTGAPKAIKALVIGDPFGILWLYPGEMKKISENLPVAYDLLPSRQYYDTKGSYVKIIETRFSGQSSRELNFDEVNDFLIDYNKLNTQALNNANNLHTVDFDNYDMRNAGVDLYSLNGCKAGTIGYIEEVRHFNIYNDPKFSSRYQIKETPGDGTVPLESSTNLPINQSNKFFALNANHAEMMSQDGIRQKIVNIITGSNLETKDITQDLSKCKLDGRAISIFSPLSIDITDQDGNHLGLSEDGVSVENNIPNADFQIIDDHKFVYLPTDEGQTYTINVAGTGDGVFTLTDATINNNEVADMQVFSHIAVTPSLLGRVNISDNSTLELDTNGDGDLDKTLEPSFVLSGEEAENFVPTPGEDVVSEEKPRTTSGSYVRVKEVEPEVNFINPVLSEIKERGIKDSQKIITKTIQEVADNNMHDPNNDKLEEENLLMAKAPGEKFALGKSLIILLSLACALLLAKKYIKL